MSKEQLISEAMTLTPEERIELAVALLDSVDTLDPHAHLSDDELRTEIERRAREVLDGTAKTVSWDDLRASIKSELDEL